jgi:hypothetical protein
MEWIAGVDIVAEEGVEDEASSATTIFALLWSDASPGIQVSKEGINSKMGNKDYFVYYVST